MYHCGLTTMQTAEIHSWWTFYSSQLWVFMKDMHRSTNTRKLYTQHCSSVCFPSISIVLLLPMSNCWLNLTWIVIVLIFHVPGWSAVWFFCWCLYSHQWSVQDVLGWNVYSMSKKDLSICSSWYDAASFLKKLSPLAGLYALRIVPQLQYYYCAYSSISYKSGSFRSGQHILTLVTVIWLFSMLFPDLLCLGVSHVL